MKRKRLHSYGDDNPRRQQLEPITRGLSWKAKHRVCRQHMTMLNEWEQNFIRDLELRWWRREYLEPKQIMKLNEIYNRLVFDRGVHYRATYGE